jgi:Putative auto-transporter adhesin, head GIN domain
MKLSVLYLLPLAALALSACDMDVNAEDKRLTSDGKAISTSAATTGSFTKIEAVGPDNIIFVTGDAFSIKAEGDADAITKLRYAMDNGTIIIGREKGKWWGDGSTSVTVTVTAPTLAEASLAGSGDFTADRMTGDKVKVELAGSGNAKVADVTAKSFESDLAGTGDIMVAGKVERAEFGVAGTGDVDASKLASVDAEVSIAGTGDVKVNATGTVDASIAGTGDISVTGGAKCKSSSIGSGKINCG